MRATLVAFGLAMCGCAPAGRQAPVPEEPQAERTAPVYIVRGQPRANWTPGWSAVFIDDRILLDSPTSAGWYAFTAPSADRADGVRTFHVGGLEIAIEDDRCRLPGFPASLPDAVRIEWDGGRFDGCGGVRAPTEEMADTVWELVRIDGEAAPVARSPAATLIFGSNGALGGTLACNDGGIETTWVPGGFVQRGGGFMQTAMGCNLPAAEAFGMRFWNGMIPARTWRRDGDRLMITLGDGREAELRRLL